MKTIQIFIFFLLINYLSFSQNSKEEAKEIINAQRTAFITKAMSLSSDEAQKLWPIMNVAEEKRENLKKERNIIRKKIELLQGAAANSDYEELINIEASFYTKEAVIFNERQQSIKKIFSAKRISELYKAEEGFKKWLIKNVKNSK